MAHEEHHTPKEITMHPEVFHGHFQMIHTDNGDIICPEMYAEFKGNEDAARACGVDPENVETVFGWGYRLQAPGYMDATEWGIADTEAEAYAARRGGN